MLPKIIVTTVAALLGAASKLLTANDQATQEEALYEAEEAVKKALDHFKFGSEAPAPPSTLPQVDP